MKQYRMYVAEFIGAGTLSLAVLLSVSTELGTLATPILAALVLGLFVYTIGGVSGCHINPAVTLGVYARGKIKLAQTVGYIVAQCLGAFAAILIVSNTVMDLSGYTMTTPESMSVFIAEFIGMTLFTFGIASVAFGKVSQVASGVVIGGSLLFGKAFLQVPTLVEIHCTNLDTKFKRQCTCIAVFSFV